MPQQQHRNHQEQEQVTTQSIHRATFTMWCGKNS